MANMSSSSRGTSGTQVVVQEPDGKCFSWCLLAAGRWEEPGRHSIAEAVQAGGTEGSGIRLLVGCPKRQNLGKEMTVCVCVCVSVHMHYLITIIHFLNYERSKYYFSPLFHSM